MYVELLTNMSATSLNCSENPRPGVLYVVTINNFQPYHQLKCYFFKSKCKNLALLISPLKYIEQPNWAAGELANSPSEPHKLRTPQYSRYY